MTKYSRYSDEGKLIYPLYILQLLKGKEKTVHAKGKKAMRGKTIVENEADAKPSDLLMDS